MNALPYLILDNAVSVTLADGTPHTINSSHLNFDAIIDAIKNGEWDEIAGLIDVPAALQEQIGGAVTVSLAGVKYNGNPVHSTLAQRMVDLLGQGFDIQPWINFMEKLYTNPDPFSITQLYGFLEAAKLPLCPDGDILAYKYVRDNYKDVYSGTFDNSVGSQPTMDRALCDNNPNNHCSSGLHFCSRGYLGSHHKVMLVKVNPRDVVSIPADHRCEKARACTYKVVGELDVDYDFDAMEAAPVVATPRTNEVPEKKRKKKKGPTELQKKIMLSKTCDVRGLAKNFRLTQSEIEATAGKYYEFFGYRSRRNIGLTIKGLKWTEANGR